MMHRNPVGNAGFQLHDIRCSIAGVGAGDITGPAISRSRHSVEKLTHGIIAVHGVPVRGELAVLKVIQRAGSATAFRVIVLDRAAEGLWDENIVYDSSQITSVVTEYPDGYGGYAAQTVRRIHQYGIGIPYQCGVGRSNSPDSPEVDSLFLAIVPTGESTDNEFDISVKLFALA